MASIVIYPFGTWKTTTSTRPTDGFLCDWVTSEYWIILWLWLSGAISTLWETSIRNFRVVSVHHHSSSWHHWSDSVLLPCGHQSSSTRTKALDISHRANICVCTIWSRPGLFVPTLFVMHDVSLTPTKKVAWWQQLLTWWILYLLWVEWDGALLYGEGSLAAWFMCDSVVCPI